MPFTRPPQTAQGPFMTLRFLSAICLFTAAALTPAQVLAQDSQEPVFQGAHNDWRVFTRGEGAGRVCYALSTPSEALPRNVDHGDIFLLVASWANGDASEQPSFMAGYPLRPDSPPQVRIGSDRFTMFVSGPEGFLEEAGDETRMVQAMRRGSVLRVEAMSERGTATVYEFSLSGVTAALREADQLC
jgi:hypothetical protein